MVVQWRKVSRFRNTTFLLGCDPLVVPDLSTTANALAPSTLLHFPGRAL